MSNSSSPKSQHRLRLPLATQQKVFLANTAACDALIAHLGTCKDCVDDFCPVAKPLCDTYRLAKMRTRLMLGEAAVTPDENSDSNPELSR